MNQTAFVRRFASFLFLVSALGLIQTLGLAQSNGAQSRPLITAPVDEMQRVQLKGSVSGRLKGAQDLGATDAAQPSGRLLLVLKRSPEREKALQTFLQQAHQQSSPNFHKWLAPAAFAQQFGADDSDVRQLTGWLQSHGLNVAKVSAGKAAIEFSGSIAQVNETFRTSIHTYSLNGETHHANASAAQIPLAFSDAVASISQLNDFAPKPQIKMMGKAAYNPKTHTGKPQWTLPGDAGNPPLYFLAPEDFATQYDVKSSYAAGITGAGQTIGIINESNIDVSLVNAYRKLFGLPVNPPQIVVDGTDPGVNGAATEAYLDVENAGAIAPAATVKLYIASSYGLLGQGGIDFASVRAVDDDVAQVLSLSFGGCEEFSENQLYNSIWEQAAAQGQTVFVSAGDSGSLGCTGLGVNGLASTPWNVAVGGSDFYLPDYATGGGSIANYWSNTNDPDYGSLQKPMLEQPWNGTQFGLNSTTYDPLSDELLTTAAGGGGASFCSTNSYDASTGIVTCIQGYPKPAWQTGTGVPSDGVRDLPDLSLFASNGINGIIWPICAEAGDCTETDPVNNVVYVNSVGGTSASSPAMAGIMALVDQKYGPQGQANFVLYPLAAQFPSVFNPIDIGSNNEACSSFDVGLEIGCAADANDPYYSLQNYYANTGYDLASGLGSVDVGALLADWSKISFKATTTTLSLNPTTLTHGQTVTANVNVTVAGAGAPSGTVGLVSNNPMPNSAGIATLQLTSAGTVSAPITYLPGGTYTLYAQYGGDGVNAVSKSSPVTVTVTPEASNLVFTPQFVDPASYIATPITNGLNVPYGSSIVFDVQINGTSLTAGANETLATGSVTYMDGSNVLGTVAATAAGTAEFSGSALTPGPHSITLSYSGDLSYKPSTAGPVSFTVVKTPSTAVIVPDNSGTYSSSDGAIDFYTGQNVSILGVIGGSQGGALPTGQVVLQLGNNAPVTVPLVPNVNLGQFGLWSGASAVFKNIAAGSYNLTMTYAGDANYAASSTSQLVDVIAPALLPSTTSIAITSPTDPTSIVPSTVVTFVATVTGNGTIAPTGTVGLILSNLYTFNPVALVPGTNGSSTATMVVRASGLLPGSNQMSFLYSGDTVYQGSSSGQTIVLDDPTDITLQALTPNIVIASGSSGTGTVTLNSRSGFTGAVAISCNAPASLLCTPGSPSVNLSANGSASVTLNINTVTTPKTTAQSHSALLGAASVPFFACMLAFLLPRRRKYGRVLFALLFCAALGSGVGCGHTATPPPVTTPVPDSNATPGTYTVVVSATTPAGVIHNQTLTILVR
jgi:hypothetical protein